MNPETKFVVNPLEKYFLDFKRSGAKWSTKHKPKFESSATGWDLQMGRKNQVLLFEAKYIKGSFASAFAGLVIAEAAGRAVYKYHTQFFKMFDWQALSSAELFKQVAIGYLWTPFEFGYVILFLYITETYSWRACCSSPWQ